VVAFEGRTQINLEERKKEENKSTKGEQVANHGESEEGSLRRTKDWAGLL